MKVIHINHSDAVGGAARAAYRIHKSLRSINIDSHMWVNVSTIGDWTVHGPSTRLAKASALLRSQLTSPLVKCLKTENPVIHSPAILPSSWIKRINSSDADIVHLHWVQGEMLSVADIGSIRKPMVWSLHDMWAFCGAEHYTEDYRWRDGYLSTNRPLHESGFDLNRWTWQRKCKHWRKPIHIVGNSKWITQCASESLLMRGWPAEFIYYPIDLGRWRPIEKKVARDILGFSGDYPLIIFGAIAGGRDPRKGFDLLLGALKHLRDDSRAKGARIAVFGQCAPSFPDELCFPITYTGHLHDDFSLRLLYSAADVMIVPSRQEAYGQTASEAHACGTPVVAFNIGGLPDIVQHERTGYLAKAFDTEDLARGIVWVLQQRETGQLGRFARERAEERFSESLVAEQYRRLYKAVSQASA